jgi:hypothetical protein
MGNGFKVPIPLVLAFLASIPLAVAPARIPVLGDSLRHRLLRLLRHIPLAVAVVPVALTGLMCGVLYIASLFERAVFSPRLLLELSGSVVLVVVFALSCCGCWKTQRAGIPLNPQDEATAAVMPGKMATPSETRQARDRRPVCGILAWAVPMLAVPAGMGVIYVLAYAFGRIVSLAPLWPLGASSGILCGCHSGCIMVDPAGGSLRNHRDNCGVQGST